MSKEAAAGLLQWLRVMLDMTDYTAQACAPTEMVGAVLPRDVIVSARAAVAKALAERAPEPEEG